MLVSSIKSLPFSFFISTIFTSLHVSPPCSETACECTFHKALNTHYHTCIHRVTSDSRTRGLLVLCCLTMKLFFSMMRSNILSLLLSVRFVFLQHSKTKLFHFTLFSKHSISHISIVAGCLLLGYFRNLRSK